MQTVLIFGLLTNNYFILVLYLQIYTICWCTANVHRMQICSAPEHRYAAPHHRKHPSGGSGCEQLVRHHTTDILQKTMTGGIFLIELSFQEVYFVVKLYVFSTSQLACKQSQHTNGKVS